MNLGSSRPVSLDAGLGPLAIDASQTNDDSTGSESCREMSAKDNDELPWATSIQKKVRVCFHHTTHTRYTHFHSSPDHVLKQWTRIIQALNSLLSYKAAF